MCSVLLTRLVNITAVKKYTFIGEGIMSQYVCVVFVSLQSRYTLQVLVHIPPRFSCTDARSSPPVINVWVKFVGEVIVQHSAQAAEKLVVDEFSCTFPLKVRVVKVVVRI